MLFQLPGPLHSSGERQVTEAQVEMNCGPEVGVHTHTHTDVPGFGTASIPATYLFGGPYSALKTKNTYFSYGFEGALVS